MFIHDIAYTQHFSRQFEGLEFSSFDEAAAAIHTLGAMLKQDPAQVEALLERMSADIAVGMTHSPFAEALMRGDSEPAGPVAGPVTLAPGGWIIGSHHSVHNESGGAIRPPFIGHAIRINEIKEEEGDTRYRLKIIDRISPMSLDPTRVGLNYTESLLAAKLGRPRQLESVHISVFYSQMGPAVDFDLAPLIHGLGAVDGLELVAGSPEDIAEGYFVQMRDDDFSDFSYQLTLGHSSGCRVLLANFAGIQTHGHTLGRQLLIRRDGSRLVGPYDDVYQPTKPFVTFVVTAPEHTGDGQPGADDVEATNQLVIGLAYALTDALWLHNLG